MSSIHLLKQIIIFFTLLLLFHEAIAGCPLELDRLNFTEAVSACSNEGGGRCCRYVNALVGISMARYANATGQLGVPHQDSETCIDAVGSKFQANGFVSNVSSLCGLGPKIPVNFSCEGIETVEQMQQTLNFREVSQTCIAQDFSDEGCRKCLSASTAFLHQLVGVEGDHMALSTCRDAVFTSLASPENSSFTVQMAGCFFGLQGLGMAAEYLPKEPAPAPIFMHNETQAISSSIFSAPSPGQGRVPSLLVPMPPPHKAYIAKKVYSTYHLALVPSVGIGVMGVALTLLLYMILLIWKKRQELSDYGKKTQFLWNKPFSNGAVWKLKSWRKGPQHAFQRFSYREIQKATNDFSTIIGKGGFGTVYKAVFGNGWVAAVKRMDKISQQGEAEFSKEMELLGRLHHRHLVTLRGFCAEKQERFLVYEYMENGSLKDHLHTSAKSSLDWRTRIQIAVDVATALEYLHFFCDPPLCHRDIKSSNILLDENFVAKVADFGLAHSAPNGAVKFEPINTDIRGTPGYMDPEYVTTQELTQKSDIYSYGVLLLELITARRAVHENKNLVEWAQPYIMEPCSSVQEIVDPLLAHNYSKEEAQSLVGIAKLCVQAEGKARPTMKQVLRLLYEKLDTVAHNLMIPAAKQRAERTVTVTVTRNGKEEEVSNCVGDASGDLKCLQASPSTSRSYCSRSFLLESSEG